MPESDYGECFIDESIIFEQVAKSSLSVIPDKLPRYKINDKNLVVLLSWLNKAPPCNKEDIIFDREAYTQNFNKKLWIALNFVQSNRYMQFTFEGKSVYVCILTPISTLESIVEKENIELTSLAIRNSSFKYKYCCSYCGDFKYSQNICSHLLGSLMIPLDRSHLPSVTIETEEMWLKMLRRTRVDPHK